MSAVVESCPSVSHPLGSGPLPSPFFLSSLVPLQCPPQAQRPQRHAHLAVQVLPDAAGLSRNSSSFPDKQRGQPDPVTRPADKCRWVGNPAGVAWRFLAVLPPIESCWQSPANVREEPRIPEVSGHASVGLEGRGQRADNLCTGVGSP